MCFPIVSYVSNVVNNLIRKLNINWLKNSRANFSSNKNDKTNENYNETQNPNRFVIHYSSSTYI